MTIEAELARANRAEIVGAFSRGLIFSKANGFSKGVFFSKSRNVLERPDERIILESAQTLDDIAFDRFAERLAAIREAKDLRSGR